jgi:septal ring factor EnvC (AmiA/AmiB activator)
MLFSCFSHAYLEESDTESDKLTNVQQKIDQQKKTITQFTSQRSKIENQLKKDDLSIAVIAKKINKTRQQLKKTQQTLKTLSKEKQVLTHKKQQQERILSQQLRAAYSAGHHDYLKLILNQEKPASIERTVTYYQYLNDARIKEIDQFQTILSKLLEVTTEHQTQAEQLQQLNSKQAEQKVAIQQSKRERRTTIKALNKDLLNSQQRLNKLLEEEENLVVALNRLSQLAQQEINLSGLSKLKKKLSWPVKGKISHSFGTRKQGYLKWKGVLLNAAVGKQVQTIHNGTVLFSDWLKGYGLVTVIDHGEGYMSLYGHNQALLKSVGDRVETGESIALVGQSGGQNQSGLYFEIRHRGKAVNPKTWCK